MPHLLQEEHSPYSARQLFDLVADIERYPEFLPWCRAARILRREGNQLQAELVVSFSHLTESYTSDVTFFPPATDGDPAAIDVRMVEGPFKHLSNHWQFLPEESGSKILLELDFKFRSFLLERMIGGIFEKAAGKMAHAFKERADALYETAP